MIIDASYFVGELHLSQVGSSSSTVANNNNRLQQALDEYEVDIMDLALGKQLSNELFSNIDTITGDIITGADARWVRLVEGHTYVKNNETYYWQGLRTQTGVIKRSLIAYYVYALYMEDDIIKKSTAGIIKPEAENSRIASVVPTITRAWRKLYKWYGDGDCYYHNRIAQITRKNGGVIYDYGHNDNTNEVSLYQFLSDNESDYQNWRFTPIENRNQFQI